MSPGLGDPLAPLPPATPFNTGGGLPPGKAPTSPFGVGGSANPYASPAPDFSSPTAQFSRGLLTPTRISFDKVFEKVWAVFQPQMGWMALMGLIFAVVIFGLQIIGYAGTVATQATREPVIIHGFTVINTVFGFVVQIWLTTGFAIYMLKAARNEGPSLNDLGAAGRSFVSAILMQLVVVLTVLCIFAVFMAPAGILYLVTREQNVGIFAGIIGFLVAIPPAVYLAYRWSLGLFFIVDCNLGPMEALSQSSKFMIGNKLISFLIFLIVFFAGTLFTVFTCLIGYVLFIPYMHLTMAAVYLSATGQPWGPALASSKN